MESLTAAQAVALGILQGLSEFLPVSSSGHLVLVPALLGWPDQGVAFDAAVHLGTAAALLVYFGRELWQTGLAAAGGDPSARRLLLGVLLGTIPAGLAGLLLEKVVETRLRSPAVVAVSLMGWAVALAWADRRAARGRIHDVTGVGLRCAVLIGCAQALALIPGTSRSGVTLTAGLAAGLDRPTAARFGFLLGLPITAAAGLVKTAAILRSGSPVGGQLVALGIATSFVAGLAAVAFLLRYLRERTLRPFVVYRIALGIVVLFWA